MNWSFISGLFSETVPVGIVVLGVTVWLIWMIATMSRDIKHLGHDIADIKENLANHITDTNKKIEKNTDKLELKIDNKTDRLELKIDDKTDKLDKDLKAGQAKLEAKIDQLIASSK